MQADQAGRHGGFRPRLLGSLLALLVVGGSIGAACAYRDDIGDPAEAEEAPEAADPSPQPTVSPKEPESSSPSPKPPREERKRRLVIHGTGDVNLDPSYIPSLAANGYRYAWTGLRGLFKRDDLTVVNLECPASDLGAPVKKEFNFRCDPAALPIMRRVGVEVANQANNHSGDLGPEALLDSRANLMKAGIRPVGVGRSARQANRPAVFRIKGWTIAVLGFGGVVPSFEWLAAPGRPGMANGDDIGSMVRAVRQADRRADLVFVTIHWGAELELEPSPEDVERAQAMIDAGADGIFGHHAHRLQPLVHYKGRPIAYGLGNFVWPNLSAAGSRTAVARFIVEPEGNVRGRLIPAVIESAGHPVLTR